MHTSKSGKKNLFRYALAISHLLQMSLPSLSGIGLKKVIMISTKNIPSTQKSSKMSNKDGSRLKDIQNGIAIAS